MSFHNGNKDGKHYWLTPPELMEELQNEFEFDFDPCPFPKPENFCGLDEEWGGVNYVNPPFGSVIKNGKKKGPTAWARKAIEENKKGKTVVLVFPTDKWIHYLIEAGAKLRSFGDVRWHATEDGSKGPGIGRFTMGFILEGKKRFMRFKIGQPVTFDIGGKPYPAVVLNHEKQTGKYLIRIFSQVEPDNFMTEVKDTNSWVEEKTLGEVE